MPPKKTVNLIPEKYTVKQKEKIINELNPVSEEQAEEDFEKLKKIGCKAKDAGLSQVGNKVVNRFTQLERFNTKSKRGLSFFDILNNKTRLSAPSIDKLLKYHGYTRVDAPLREWKRIFEVYYGSINIFRPLIAMDIYCRYKPNTVLDFTMGWGGRMVGACALNIPKYIGIDYNSELKKPYEKLQDLMDELSETETELYFQDAVKFDYSKITYDMVLTSPPYYNIEIYRGVPVKSKDDWDRDFYIPLFEKTWKGLKKGGHYCLNIPLELYERVASKILGSPTEQIQLKKAQRRQTGKALYGEYIYVWRK